MRRLAAALLTLTLFAAACGDDGDNASEPTTTTTEAPPTTEAPTTTAAPTTTLPLVRASAGCGAGAAAGTEAMTVDTADGLTRDYRRHLPAAYDDATALPLILNFHGLTSNIEQQVSLSRLEPLADTEGFMVVTPQGTDRTPGVPFWNASPITEGVVDDTAFVHELLDTLEVDTCIDLDRVYSTGMSNGGFMSGHLACVMPDRIAAIASVTGLTWPANCADDRAVPVLHFHGTEDGIVRFDNIPATVAAWADANGCTPSTVSDAVSDEVEHLVYACPSGAEVEFYIVDGGGHTWPGTPLTEALAALLGYTTEDIDATALAWEFFQRHSIA